MPRDTCWFTGRSSFLLPACPRIASLNVVGNSNGGLVLLVPRTPLSLLGGRISQLFVGEVPAVCVCVLLLERGLERALSLGRVQVWGVSWPQPLAVMADSCVPTAAHVVLAGRPGCSVPAKSWSPSVPLLTLPGLGEPHRRLNRWQGSNHRAPNGFPSFQKYTRGLFCHSTLIK